MKMKPILIGVGGLLLSSIAFAIPKQTTPIQAKAIGAAPQSASLSSKMNITLRSGNSWSDGIYVSAEDCIYAWKRVLDPEFNSEACCLLYDILNAREAKQGDCSIDDVGIYAIDELVLQITFVGDIDYNAFLLNLTSIALAPLRERIVEKNGDWAKKPATTVNSGPFMIRRVNYGFDTANTPDPSYVFTAAMDFAAA